MPGRQAAWPSGLGRGLQSPVRRFDSARRLCAVPSSGWLHRWVPRAAPSSVVLPTADRVLGAIVVARGRLAQLVAHLHDAQGVVGSSPAPPTKEVPGQSGSGQGLLRVLARRPGLRATMRTTGSDAGGRRSSRAHPRGTTPAGSLRMPSYDSPLSPRSIHVGAVVDPDDLDHLLGLVELIDDPVRPSTGRPHSRELSLERVADLARCFDQWPHHELHGGGGDLRWQSAKRPFSTGRYHEPPWICAQRLRYLARSASASTT